MNDDKVIFDSEPLIAHATDEPGAETVEKWLESVTADNINAYVNHVNLTEVRYILSTKYRRRVADEYIDWLLDLGIKPINPKDTWKNAAEFIIDYNPALGDSYALATAKSLQGILIVGADNDYDEISETEDFIERFRDHPA